MEVFIDPSGVKCRREKEGNEAFVHTFSQPLPPLFFIFTHNMSCNEMRKAYEPEENYDDKVLSSLLCVYNNNYRELR